MIRRLTSPADPRGKWIVLGAWLLAAAAALALGLPGRFAAAQSADATAFLPAGAESTRAVEVQRRAGGEPTPIVVVYHRRGGLTSADLEQGRLDRRELQAARRARPAIYRHVRSVGEPFASFEGDAQLLVVEAVAPGGAEDLAAAVEDVRARVRDPGGGLAVKVTGPAAFAADAERVLEDIDARLLLAALLLVVVLLALIYRSPALMALPLAAVGAAELATRSLGWALAELGATLSDQGSSIVSVLVLGTGTDYALLLIARYREELRRHPDAHAAMAHALRAAGPAVAASGATVAAALLCLALADVPATRGVGPLGALGVAMAVLAMLTLLPALLAIAGRRAFWRPALPGRGDGIPRRGEAGNEQHGRWRRLGERVARRPRATWAAAVAALLAMALGWLAMDTGLTQTEAFRTDVDSVAGQRLVATSFSAGASAPTQVIVPPARVPAVPAIQDAVRALPGVADVGAPEPGPGGVGFDVVLDLDPYSRRAYELIPAIRGAAGRAGGPGVLVGGATAVEADLREAAARDNRVIVPATLLAVLLVLAALLRSAVAPPVLVATVLLSFLAALGFSLVVFRFALGFPGVDPSLPLFAFVFLVALGVDYNIFLMARAREETARHGAREGMLRALALTGAVITSAGVVLAGTFAVLTVLPLVFLTEIGFVIAFGVLLDTFLVRSVLVPALVLDLGPRTWWPSAPARMRRNP